MRAWFKTFLGQRKYDKDVRVWNKSERKQAIDMERDLPPRPLTQDELSILTWILVNGSEEAKSFLPQVDGIRGVRSCTCGCPTIRLVPDDSTPCGDSTTGNIIGDCEGRTALNELVGILLFQKGGRLSELEVYSMDGKLATDSMEFGLPLLESMSVLQWEPIPGHPNAMRVVKSP